MGPDMRTNLPKNLDQFTTAELEAEKMELFGQIRRRQALKNKNDTMLALLVNDHRRLAWAIFRRRDEGKLRPIMKGADR